ncbi:MAG: hypothetical protein C4560_11705 [Nitrospiraceae bacterium]|nr:MAG: hypothetical protein C4560_11705 [Nitrospiraceae bacterium]
MEPTIAWYLRMSVIYFVAGAVIGFIMILSPDSAGHYISVHAHFNLLGFMSMMIYGVGYHILPKFSGRQMYSPLIMRIQFWVANAGLLGMALGWPLRSRGDVLNLAGPVLIIASLLSLLAVVLFAFNMLKTIKSV